LNAFLLEFVMLYSKTFRLRPGPFLQTFLLLATLLLSCQLGIAQSNDLIGSDMGLPSSEPDNSLIDTDTIAPTAPEPKLSPAEAAELVRNKVGGQVMSVNTRQDDTRVVYGVKVLNAGRMRVINVDGQTGQLLNH
jgi:hypothetical protein